MTEPSPRKGLIARWIERRFGGYRHRFNVVDEALPLALAEPRKVAVIGSGLAGLGAAAKLAARGFEVVVFERNASLGGKLGAWPTTLPDGTTIGMAHGFHAFFRHYYNLNSFLAEVGVAGHYRELDDYRILTLDGRSVSFKGVATTPLINLISLARKGVYDFWKVAGRHTGPKMRALLRYDPVATWAEWDTVSYAQFAEQARLPNDLRLVFNTFARAFFADAEKMSMAALIESFHFYYLSNDAGLDYDYLGDDFARAFAAPIQARLDQLGVALRLSTPVESIACTPARAGERTRFTIADESFDYLVIASDVVGTRAMFERSPTLAAAAPATAAEVAALKVGQRYAVLRLWLDRDTPRELPVFVITEREQVLDAVCLEHRAERESAEWVAGRLAAGLQGGVFELHCYAVPEQLPGETTIAGSDTRHPGQAELRERFLAEFHRYFPELADATIVHETMYVREDFPAFHVGTRATRPSGDTDLPELRLAGDWVALPLPAMLMEAAYTAGLLASNGFCSNEGLREDQVWSVPPRGFMAGRRPAS
ncbi:FAD-dependent oxidoreductase [Nannocystaceae bacterium ST9]